MFAASQGYFRVRRRAKRNAEDTEKQRTQRTSREQSDERDKILAGLQEEMRFGIQLGLSHISYDNCCGHSVFLLSLAALLVRSAVAVGRPPPPGGLGVGGTQRPGWAGAG